METRNVTLTLKQAKEWYNKGGDLREVALQAFTEKELKTRSFKDLTCFKDVLTFLDENDALGGSSIDSVLYYINNLENSVSVAAAANAKLSLIRKALNYGEEMELTKGTIYYPYTPFAKDSSTYYNSEIQRGEMEVVAKFKVGSTTYKLLGGGAAAGAGAGLGSFHSTHDVGYAAASVGFLGSKTREIAEHFGRYFWKEIFEAKYADFVTYKWL